jgi:hypothetical protein
MALANRAYFLRTNIHMDRKEHSYLCQGRDHANGDVELHQYETGIWTHDCLIMAVAHERKCVQHLAQAVLWVRCGLQYAVAVVVVGPVLGRHENCSRSHA